MRLKNSEIAWIKNAIASLDRKAVVYLFGSRTDDNKKGGDIDLLIFSQKLQADSLDQIRSSLYSKIGEQKIDILIAKDETDPLVRIAKKEGILL